MYHQYIDLPQIPSTEEEFSYPQWNGEANYEQPAFRYEGHYRYNLTEHEVAGLHTMKRFLEEPLPVTSNLVQPKFERPIHDYQHSALYEQRLAPELRYPSPDQTAISEHSSYTAANEAKSPYHQYQYISNDFTQYNLPYIPTDHMQPVCTGGSVSMRELQLEPEVEPELVDEVDTITIKTEAPFESQPAPVKTDTPVDNHKVCSEPCTDIYLKDGEYVLPMTPEEESSSDTEYTPGQSPRRRSSASNSSSSRNGPRRRLRANKKISSSTNANRVSKRSGRNTVPCAIANVYTNAQQNILNTTRMHPHLQHGTDTQRYFPCPLSMYGCQSTFCSKNEWKRHVSTQHIKLGFWRCDLCNPNVDHGDDQTSYYNDFNRKDLFTQHLRRMHMKPAGERRDDERWPVTEENIAENQMRCFMTLRDTPQQSQCIFCPELFQGPMSWESRMEHIGRHMEKDRRDGVTLGDVHTWIPDPKLEAWLDMEGIITKNKDGLFEIGDGKSRRATARSDEE